MKVTPYVRWEDFCIEAPYWEKNKILDREQRRLLLAAFFWDTSEDESYWRDLYDRKFQIDERFFDNLKKIGVVETELKDFL